MFLTTAEADAIDAAVARVEAHTGVQIVTAVVGKSDSYVELPWKAFALGASLAAFGVVLVDAWRPAWPTATTALVHAVVMLGVGGASALFAVFVPAFGRLFLRATRSELEVRQYAESLFLRRGLFGTAERTGVLVLVSLFERRVEILPDTGLHGPASEADWGTVVARMTPLLRRRRPFHALEEGLGAIDALLAGKGFRTAAAAANELPDRPIEERGA
jgi:putative membrane protein